MHDHAYKHVKKKKEYNRILKIIKSTLGIGSMVSKFSASATMLDNWKVMISVWDSARVQTYTMQVDSTPLHCNILILSGIMARL